jgi:hypothetical protein
LTGAHWRVPARGVLVIKPELGIGYRSVLHLVGYPGTGGTDYILRKNKWIRLASYPYAIYLTGRGVGTGGGTFYGDTCICSTERIATVVDTPIVWGFPFID